MALNYKNIIDKAIEKVELAINDSNVDVINIYQNYKPTLRQPWARVALLPSESSNVSQGIDSIIEHTGLIQIDYFTPKGTTINFSVVDSIIEEFNQTRVIDTDIVSDRTWRGADVIEETDWIRTPVFVRFRYYEYNVSVGDA